MVLPVLVSDEVGLVGVLHVAVVALLGVGEDGLGREVGR